MAQFVPDESSFSALTDKVVVLTGGATGIGAVTITQLYEAGAIVVFGDIAKEHAE